MFTRIVLLPLLLWSLVLPFDPNLPVVPPGGDPPPETPPGGPNAPVPPDSGTPPGGPEGPVPPAVPIPFAAPTDSPPEQPKPPFAREPNVFDPTRQTKESPLVAPEPGNVKTDYELAPDGEGYYIHKRVGGEDIEPPSYITKEQFEAYQEREQREAFFREQERERAGISVGGNSLIPPINVNRKWFQTIFGSNKIDIRPNISVLLDFSLRRNVILNPSLTQRQQRNTTFFFDQQINLAVRGQIGDLMDLNINYDTEATFQFENQFKLAYEGREDDVLKIIEAGNVSLPLNGSLITGAQNLWGVKLGMQFGPVWITTVASQSRGQKQEITFKNGGTQTPFNLKASAYDYNRHFFLGHYFREYYESGLNQLPNVNTPFTITRVEVWVTNRNAASLTNNRNAVGFADLGESPFQAPNAQGQFRTIDRRWNPEVAQSVGGQRAPNNNSNTLFNAISTNAAVANRNSTVSSLEGLGLANGEDFELIENMRLLQANEYTLNPQLGYISLNTRLQERDVLFVAYEFTVAGSNDVLRVGEFSQDKPAEQNNTNVLFLKMLKPSSIRPELQNRPFPTWDLMMKNVYNIGGYNLSAEGFRLDITYEATDGSGDVVFFPEGSLANRPLIQVFNVDQLVNNLERRPDNYFDFIPGVTVIPDKGAIVFPNLEPFGSYLVEEFERANPATAEADSAAFAYSQLYRLTQQDAIQFFPQLDRYKFTGEYAGAGAGGDIYLNSVQVAEGSVVVLAGGQTLTEGVDYTVDYAIGKVTLLNPGVLGSGQDIKVQFESNNLFGIDQKSLVGVRLDYKQFKNLNIGGTFIYMNERPLINKVNIGDEPFSNFIWGVDLSTQQQSGFLTRAVDKILPFHQTKTASNISFTGEVAQLVPGVPRQIKTDQENGVAYIDDFEGARAEIDLLSVNFWKHSSRPLAIPVGSSDPLAENYRRAKLAWYRIDPTFYNSSGTYGLESTDATLNAPYTRQAFPQEVFPRRRFLPGNNILATFDLHYMPRTRGVYNYQAAPGAVNPDGTLNNPEQNWGGIIRQSTANTDFEAANFQFIEFWLLDPFQDGSPNDGTGGELVFNLGKISEDVLPDNRRSFENGLPANAADNAADLNLTRTDWGRVPEVQVVTNAFDNDPAAREFQDVGLDGLRDEDERDFYSDFLTAAQGILSPEAFAALEADPSSDNYRHFANNDDPLTGQPDNPDGAPLLDRYLDFNGLEGNAPINDPNATTTRSASPNPDVEDINADGTLNSSEAYYEYKVSLRPSDLAVGENFIVDRRDTAGIELPNGDLLDATWYLFRIPLVNGTPVNGIQDLKSVDFIRMYLTDFADTAILRFASLALVSTQWRPDPVVRTVDVVGEDVGETEPNEIVNDPNAPNYFELGTINIEENGSKEPYNYQIPPRIERQGVPGSAVQGLLQNEQSLLLRTRNLQDGFIRGTFRNFDFDLRNYERVRLWAHAEALVNCAGGANVIADDDVTLLVRLGSDYTNNYYEVEFPLALPPDGDPAPNPEDLWNDLEIVLADLPRAKQNRGAAGVLPNANPPYEEVLPDGRVIRVIGTPLLNQVQSIWIGVKNPLDNGGDICADVWVNELRVTDFNTESSWAANARVNVKLADFANIQASVSKATAYFGSVEQRVSERSLEDNFRYDIAANVNAGLLLPKKAKIEIPFFISFGEQYVTPLYNPLNPDVRLDDLDRDSFATLIDAAVDYTRNFSYSFNNVRVLPWEGKEKSWPWDIQNFAFTYGYNEELHRNLNIEEHRTQNYTGAIQYTYNLNTKPVEPFKNVGKNRNPIKAFNFYYAPKSFLFRIEGNRHFEKNQLRSVNGGSIENNAFRIPATYNQNFLITRTYNLRWDLTRSISLNYSARALARVDEPFGDFDDAKRDTFRTNILSFGEDLDNPYPKYSRINLGRTINFDQQTQLTYRLPLNLIKPLDWINANLSYNAGLVWTSATLDNLGLGNTIANTRNLQFTAQFNLRNLYNEFPIIKEILKPIPRKNIYTLKDKKEDKDAAKSDSTRTKGDGLKVAMKRLGKTVAGWIFSVQSIDFTYGINQGTQFAGYLPRADNFGIDFGYRNPNTGERSNTSARFAFGWQPDLSSTDFLAEATAKGWFTDTTAFFTPFTTLDSRNFSARTNFELFKGFRVDVNFTRQTSENYSALWAFDTTANGFVLSNRTLQGQYTTSWLSIGSIFEGDDSQAFNDFQNTNRRILSERWATENPDYATILGAGDTLPGVITSQLDGTNGYFNGYTGSQQDVLLTAFLASYGTSNPNRMNLSPFPTLPLPNWTVNYNGLTDIPAFKRAFKTITIRHAYRSTYTTSYILNNRGLENTGEISEDGFTPDFALLPTADSTAIGVNGDSITVVNFEPVYTITSATINESFSPLIGINFGFNNGISLQTDFKRSRTITLNVGALQVNEIKNTELALNLSWTRQKTGNPIKIFGREIGLKNQLTLRFETTLRNTKTQNRRLDSGEPIEPTAGTFNFTVKPSVDYSINTQVNIRIYGEHTRNRPVLSTSFPTRYTAVGVQVRFNLTAAVPVPNIPPPGGG